MANGKSQKKINQEHDEDIDQLYDHAKVANEEMGAVKRRLAVAKNDIEWIKNKLDMVNNRLWWILGTVVIGILIQIVMKLYG